MNLFIINNYDKRKITNCLNPLLMIYLDSVWPNEIFMINTSHSLNSLVIFE